MDEILNTQTAQPVLTGGPDVVLEVLDAPSIVPTPDNEGKVFTQDEHFSPEEAGAAPEVVA